MPAGDDLRWGTHDMPVGSYRNRVDLDTELPSSLFRQWRRRIHKSIARLREAQRRVHMYLVSEISPNTN